MQHLFEEDHFEKKFGSTDSNGNERFNSHHSHRIGPGPLADVHLDHLCDRASGTQNSYRMSNHWGATDFEADSYRRLVFLMYVCCSVHISWFNVTLLAVNQPMD